MATYRTLTYLDAYRPSVSAMSSAPTLSFNGASQTFLQLGYENVAEIYESGSYASLRDLFKVNLTEGNKYFIYSNLIEYTIECTGVILVHSMPHSVAKCIAPQGCAAA